MPREETLKVVLLERRRNFQEHRNEDIDYKETRSFNQIHVAYVIGQDSFIQNLDQ